jgi:GH25 family lysozyme M1 (1,4-beta-N-acetylmuramidase)
VQLYGANGTGAQRWMLAYDAMTGYYTVTGVGSARCLDVAGASNKPETNVIIYASNNTIAQKWTIAELPAGSGRYELRSACEGMALDAKGGVCSNGTNVQTYTKNNTDAQRWLFTQTRIMDDGLFTVQSALGTVLDVAGNATADGTNVQAWSNNYTLAQKWQLRYASNNRYTIESVNTGKLLDVHAGKGPNVQIYSANGTNAQLWRLIPAGNNSFYLRSEATGAVLDVLGASADPGTNVQVYALNRTVAQRWSFVSAAPLKNGETYTVTSSLASGKVLDIAGASLNAGAALQLSSYHNTNSQRFVVTRLADGSYRFENKLSRLSLQASGGSVDAGGNGSVQQGSWNAAPSQTWRVEYVGNGNFRMVSSLNNSSAMAVQGGSTADGTPILLRPRANVAEQYFRFSALDSSEKQLLDGIDVSSWQPPNIGEIVPYDFMIVKATQGDWYTNPYLSQQANSALNHTGLLGLYHFAESSNAVAEARHFVSRSQPYIGRAILVLDYEAGALSNGREWVRAFMREVKRLTGVNCAVYCSASPASDQSIPQLCDEEGALFWNANYWYGNQEIQGYRHDITPQISCDIFQYTSTGRLPGFSGNLDLDLFYGSSGDWLYYASH